MDMSSTSSGYNSESSNDALVYSGSDNGGLTFTLSKEIIEEEERSSATTALEKDRLRAQIKELDAERKEQCYKKLMILLGKSTHYSNFITKKLLQSQEKLVKSKENDAKQIVDSIIKPVKKGEYIQVNDNIRTLNKENMTSGRNKRILSPEVKQIKNKKKKVQNDHELCVTKVEAEPSENMYVNELGIYVSNRQPHLLVGAAMRDYQLDGLDWLLALFENGVNGILADEMGLGKTIQVISLICHLMSKQVFGPFLIIAPLSTLPNWMLEFSKFAPSIKVILYHGNEQKRKSLKSDFNRGMLLKNKANMPVVLTSYEIPLRDTNFFRKVCWRYVIIDEGHRLKNYQSLLSRELRTYSTDNRLILTGTPLQNNLTELWSLLNFLVPEIFDDINMFQDLFDFSDLEDSEKQNRLIEKEQEQQIISKMHQILEPFFLRRLKADVNIKLPRKKELLVYTPLSSCQEELYKAILNHDYEKLSNKPVLKEIEDDGTKKKRSCTLSKVSYVYSSDFEDDEVDENLEDIKEVDSLSVSEENQTAFRYNVPLKNISMQLRKVVNHPYLVKMPVDPITKEIIVDEELINKSGKLLVLDAMLVKLKERNHKVLLFSTFTMMLDLIEEFMLMRKYKYLRLDGNYTVENRMESIKEFNSDPDMFIFLISTRAGGLGINLTAADTVIIYNSDWNPQVDLQAQDRCHRLGQLKPVVVYRFVSTGTVDQKIVERAASKRRLEKLVVRTGKFKSNGTNDMISINELKELFQSTDYSQVIHSNGFVLSDQELENLLDRSDLIDNIKDENSNKSLATM